MHIHILEKRGEWFGEREGNPQYCFELGEIGHSSEAHKVTCGYIEGSRTACTSAASTFLTTVKSSGPVFSRPGLF